MCKFFRETTPLLHAHTVITPRGPKNVVFFKICTFCLPVYCLSALHVRKRWFKEKRWKYFFRFDFDCFTLQYITNFMNKLKFIILKNLKTKNN